MTIAFSNAGAVATTAANPANIGIAYPTSIVAGALLTMQIGVRPNAANVSTPPTLPSGWFWLDKNEGIVKTASGTGGYTATIASDTGNMNQYVMGKVAAGTETGTLTVTISGGGANTVAIGQMKLWTKTNSTWLWSVSACYGYDTTTGNTSVAADRNPDITAGDIMDVTFICASSAVSPPMLTGPVLAATGVSAWGTWPAVDGSNRVTVGNHIALWSNHVSVNTGTSTAAPTFTATATATNTTTRGPVSMLRIREINPSSSAAMADTPDNFTTANTTKWDTTNGFPTNPSVSAGQLNITPTTGYPSITTTATYDLTSESIQAQLVQKPAPSTGGSIGTYLQIGVDNSHYVQWGTTDTGFVQAIWSVGTEITLAQPPYFPGMWLRLRELSGVIYWDISTDGHTWVNVSTWTWTLTAVTAMFARFSSGYFNTETITAGAIWDNYEIDPLGATPAAGTGSLVLTGTGATAARGTGTGSLVVTGSGTPAAPSVGAGSLVLTGTGTGAGRLPSSTGSLVLTGTGATQTPAAGTGSLTLNGAGATATPAAGAGSLTLSGTGTGRAAAAGTGSLTLTGTGAAGKAIPSAGMIVPLYTYPTLDTTWDDVIADPTGTAYVIVPDRSGNLAGQSADANYAAKITAARSAGLGLAYYVDTNYAAVALATVKANMDAWIALYGAPQAWFFDRASGLATDLAYYQSLYAYAGAPVVILNQGSTPDQQYLSVAGTSDICCIAESPEAAIKAWSYPSWLGSYPRGRFMVLAHSVASDLSGTWASIPATVGHRFVTNSSSYAGLPPYWATEKKLASGLNVGDLTLTGSGSGRVPSSGTGSMTLTGSGAVRAPGAGTGGLILTGAGAAAVSAAGSGSLVLTATGTASSQGTVAGSASLVLTGTATAAAPATGAGSLVLTGTGAARGAAAGSGSLVLTAAGSTSGQATGTGALVLTGGGAGAAPAAGGGSVVLTGTGATPGAATGAGSLLLTGSGASSASPAGAGGLVLTGTGTATAPAAGAASLVLTGTGTARTTTAGTGSLQLTGSGTSRAAAAGAGSLVLTGTGSTTVPAAGSGSLVLAGSGTATGPNGAAGAGSITVTGSGSGVGGTTAAGSVVLTGTGATSAPTAGSGSVVLTGSGVTAGPTVGTASIVLTGAATAKAAAAGAASMVLTGSGTALTPAAGTGQLVLTATGTAGQPGPTGTGLLVLTGTGAAPGAVSGIGGLLLTGAGSTAGRAAGAGLLVLTGVGTASGPYVPPTYGSMSGAAATAPGMASAAGPAPGMTSVAGVGATMIGGG